MAIQPPEEIRAALASMNPGPPQSPERQSEGPSEGQSRQQSGGQSAGQSGGQSGWRWVPQENIHLTVRFLGPISQETLELLMPEMNRLGRVSGRIEIEIEHVSGFPAGRPVVIAAAIAPTRKLTRLAKRVEKMVTGVGIEADPRPFQPHITIARLPRAGPRTLNLHVALRRSFTAYELVLFKSELGRDGVRYLRLHSTRLVG